MMTATECPTSEELRAFSLGEMPEEQSDEFFQHLRDCQRCKSELETVEDANDSLIASLRTPDDHAEFDREPDCKVAVAKALGAADVGQAVVVQQGLVLAVEALEGTDALLRRAAELRRDGPGGVLIKVTKPRQERRADLPSIGSGTVEGSATAGLKGIALEAGGTLIIDREAVIRAADAAGLFIVGLPPSS